MERNANYAAVGAFVLLVVVLGGLFVYWYSDSRESRDYNRYEVYFQGSVSGLTVGGPVRYLGVDVGRVVRIRVDPRAPDRVQVVADIDASAPISDATLAQLSLQGVTGVLFIDLQQNTGRKEANPAPPSERYPVIRTVPSSFDAFLASLPDLTGRVRELINRAQDVLSRDNVDAISRVIGSLDKATGQVPATLTHIDELVTELRGTTSQMNQVAETLRKTTDTVGPDLSKAIESLRMTSQNIATFSERLDHMIEENRGDLRAFTREGLPEFERLLREARTATQEFSELSRSLRDEPSRLLFEPKYHGVEVPQ